MKISWKNFLFECGVVPRNGSSILNKLFTFMQMVTIIFDGATNLLKSLNISGVVEKQPLSTTSLNRYACIQII